MEKTLQTLVYVRVYSIHRLIQYIQNLIKETFLKVLILFDEIQGFFCTSWIQYIRDSHGQTAAYVYDTYDVISECILTFETFFQTSGNVHLKISVLMQIRNSHFIKNARHSLDNCLQEVCLIIPNIEIFTCIATLKPFGNPVLYGVVAMREWLRIRQ